MGMSMRKLMTLVEAYFDTQRVHNEYFQGDVEIFSNPSRAEFAKLMRASGAMRGFYDVSSDTVYVWAGSALHADIEVDGEVFLEWTGEGECLVGYHDDSFEDVLADDEDADLDAFVMDRVSASRRLAPLVANVTVRLVSR
jgi:hypothetical protein